MQELKHKWIEKVSGLVDNSLTSLEKGVNKVIPEKKTYTIKIKVPKSINKKDVFDLVKDVTGIKDEYVEKTTKKVKKSGKSLISSALKVVNKGLDKMENSTDRALRKLQKEEEYEEFMDAMMTNGEEIASEIYLDKEIKEEE